MEKSGEVQATRDQRDMQAVAELLPLEDAKEECKRSESSCRAKCAKDGLYCAALAWVIAETQSRLSEAAAIARDACEDGQGSPSACWTSARLEEDRAHVRTESRSCGTKWPRPQSRSRWSNDG